MKKREKLMRREEKCCSHEIEASDERPHISKYFFQAST